MPPDEVWPPPVFREVAPCAADRAHARRFELVDVGGPANAPLASIDVEITGSVWRLVDGSATSPPVALRLIADVRTEGMRGGATLLAAGPDCDAIIIEAVLASGGRDEGKRVVIDV